MTGNVRSPFLLPAGLAIALAFVPGAARANSTTCATSTVCAEYINTYTYSSGMTTGGVAIHGEANSGIGVRGTSVTNVGFYGASGSGAVTSPGVEGESSQGGSGVGGAFGLAAVYGPDNAPSDGVDAYGLRFGVSAEEGSPGRSSAFGYGAQGIDYLGEGSMNGDYNAGVYGNSLFGTAVLAEAGQTSPAEGYYGEEPVGVYSVAATDGTPKNVAYAFIGESDGTGFVLNNTYSGANTFLNTVTGFLFGNGSGSFLIDYKGNETLSGTLTTSKGTYVRTTGRSGVPVREYATRGTTANVEDFGEAQLSNGRAFVPIDARFADTIDRNASYFVFVTPEGDGGGLFVTEKTRAGFVVREMDGGHSSLAFQYRIVAKPVDENGRRLEAMPDTPLAAEIARLQSHKPERVARPLSRDERMREELGSKRYAAEVNALRARLESTR